MNKQETDPFYRDGIAAMEMRSGKERRVFSGSLPAVFLSVFLCAIIALACVWFFWGVNYESAAPASRSRGRYTEPKELWQTVEYGGITVKVPLDWTCFDGQYYAESGDYGAVFAITGMEDNFGGSFVYLEDGEMTMDSAQAVYSMFYKSVSSLGGINVKDLQMDEVQAVQYANLNMYSCDFHFKMYDRPCTMELILYYNNETEQLIFLSFSQNDDTPTDHTAEFYEILESVRKK